MDRELIWRWFNIVLIVATTIGIIYPAFVDERTSLTQIIISLFEPNWSLTWVSRWLVVLVFLGSAYAFVVGRVYRNIPITILSSKLDLIYLTPDGSRVQIRRTQTLRANQRNVTAIMSTHSPSSATGRVVKADITASAFCQAGSLDHRNEIYGQENKSVELIQMFNRPMPYVWYMPVIPIWMLRSDYDRIPRVFRKYIVSRTSSVVYENEFTEPVMQFAADAYPSHNVVLTLDFSNSAVPAPHNVTAMRIKNHGVVILGAEYRHAERKVIFRVDSLANERLRISWPPPQ